MGKIIKKIKSGLFGKTKPQPEDYKSHYNYKHGLELKESGDYYEAYLSFVKEVEECPQNGYAYNQMADLCHGTQQLGLALNAATEAIAVLSHDKDSLYESYSRRAQINRDLGNEQEMLYDLNAAISLKPEKEELYFMRAGYYSLQEDYEKSDADYRKYAELVPGCPYPLAGLGQNLLKQGKTDEARLMFEQCIRLAPNYEIAYAFLGQCKFKQGDILGCIEDCLTCLRLDPENQIAEITLLGDVAGRNHRLLATKLQTCIMQDPDNERWVSLLASCYSWYQYNYKAIKLWNMAYNINPDPKYLIYMSDGYERVGDFVRAENCLRRVLESIGDNYDLRSKLSVILLFQARYEEALHQLEICRQQRLDDPQVLIKMSNIYRILDHDEESLECAQLAISLAVEDWDVSTSWLSLARIYEKMEDIDKRDDALKIIVSLDSYGFEKWFALSWLGRCDEALELIGHKDSNDSYYLLHKATVLAIANRIDEAAEVLQKTFQSGYRCFDLILHDDTFQDLHKIPDLEEQVALWRAKANQEYEEKNREIFGFEA